MYVAPKILKYIQITTDMSYKEKENFSPNKRQEVQKDDAPPPKMLISKQKQEKERRKK